MDGIKSLLTNWKTTSFGISAILIALADIIHPSGGGNPNLGGDITAILTGIGLVLGKDWNK